MLPPRDRESLDILPSYVQAVRYLSGTLGAAHNICVAQGFLRIGYVIKIDALGHFGAGHHDATGKGVYYSGQQEKTGDHGRHPFFNVLP